MLLDFFEKSVFPAIQQLTKPGSPFEGYLPVFQGDNAGPHTDAKYEKFCKEFCTNKGWLWEPQAPQMPHMNVLDLSIFPAMSRRHCHLIRSMHGVRVVRENEIWDAAKRVWDTYPSSKVANAFVQCKRNAEKIIQAKGGNEFLAGVNGTIASNVRKDFNETDEGNKRRDGKKLNF